MTSTVDFQVDTERKEIAAGDFIFNLVMDGYYRLDGGAMYGMVPRPIWEKIEKHDDRNRLYMAMNCLLARRGDRIYLADAGIGDKMDEKSRDIFGIEKEKTLVEELADLGVTREMVTHVIPTHLHFDHAGWIQDNDGNLTFPNAKYYIQKLEWEEAWNPHVRFKASYLKNYYSALKDSNQLVILEGSTQIDRGVWAYLTPGHSKGHQIVVFDSGERKAAHFGDMAAMASQVRQNWTCGFDRAPEETITNKLPFLEKALREKWLIMSAHDRNTRIGELEKVKGRYVLRKIL